MATRDFDNPDAMSATAYANRVLLLNLVEALEMDGVPGLSLDLAKSLSKSIGKEPQSRIDAIFELTEELEVISETVNRRAGSAAKGCS